MAIRRSFLAGVLLVLVAFMQGCEYRLVAQAQYRVSLTSPNSLDFVSDLEEGLGSIGFRSLSTLPAELEMSVRSYSLNGFRVSWFFEEPGTLLVSCTEDREQFSNRGKEICDEVGRILESLPAEVVRLEKMRMTCRGKRADSYVAPGRNSGENRPTGRAQSRRTPHPP